MKRFAHLTTTPVVLAFFYLTFPETADVSLDQGSGSAIARIVVGVLVGGLFVGNHFKHRIKTIYRNVVSRRGKREGVED